MSSKHTTNKKGGDKAERWTHIRSFAPSRGRLNERQQALLSDTNPHRMSVATLAERLKGLSLPVVLEIGFGVGDSLYRMAQDHPDRLFVGVEVYASGVAQLLERLADAPLPNLWVVRDDAVAVMAALPEACLHKIQLFFPDPWPKTRHHKRRLVQKPWLEASARLVKPGGFLHMATDWRPYAEHMQEQTAACAHLWASVALPHVEAERPGTKFEARGERLGCPPTDLLFQRVF